MFENNFIKKENIFTEFEKEVNQIPAIYKYKKFFYHCLIEDGVNNIIDDEKFDFFNTSSNFIPVNNVIYSPTPYPNDHKFINHIKLHEDKILYDINMISIEGTRKVIELLMPDIHKKIVAKNINENVDLRNIFNYCLLYLFGGVTTNSNAKLIKPLDGLIENLGYFKQHQIILAYEPEEHNQYYEYFNKNKPLTSVIGNHIMISVPKHPFWIFLLNYIIDNYEKNNTGSLCLTNFYNEHWKKQNLQDYSVSILDSKIFYPKHCSGFVRSIFGKSKFFSKKQIIDDYKNVYFIYSWKDFEVPFNYFYKKFLDIILIVIWVLIIMVVISLYIRWIYKKNQTYNKNII